jgi:hypothetical protein
MECAFLAEAVAGPTTTAASFAETELCAAAFRFESKSRFKRLNSARISEAV